MSAVTGVPSAGLGRPTRLVMDPVEAVERLGGCARRIELLRLTTRAALERATRDGSLLRVARGRYAVRDGVETAEAARRLSGTAILLSAAAHYGWATTWRPRRPQVAVPRGRRVAPSDKQAYDVRWLAMGRGDVVDGWVTTPVRTVMDCANLLPFGEALAVADSAMRSGLVTRARLRAAIASVPPKRRRRVMRVVEATDARSANPFESMLRALALDVPGFAPVPQVRIDDVAGFVGRVDLADSRLGIVLEAESLEFHGSRQAFDRDCERYTRLTLAGWLVLRFTWYQVMTRPGWVRARIAEAVALRRPRELPGKQPADDTNPADGSQPTRRVTAAA